MPTQHKPENGSKEDCLKLLEQIVRHWPKADGSESQDYRSQLVPFLTEEFDHVDFTNKLGGVGEVVDISTTSEKVDIEFSDSDGCLQKAVFIKQHGDWRLQ